MTTARLNDNRIRVSQHEPQTVKWWHEQFRQERLDMSPPFQRHSELWNAWKQAHLIDSILNDYDVPKFYVANFAKVPSKLNTRKFPYAVIDGKQRFEALFNFLDNELRLNQSFVLEADPSQELAGLDLRELRAKHPILATKFEQYKPVVMSVAADSTEKIQQMFIRLNSGEPINSAERRNAMPGPVPAIVRNLTVHPFFQDRVSFHRKRMQDFNLAAKLLLIEYRGRFVDTKASNLDRFVLDATPSKGKRARKKPVPIAELAAAEERVLKVLETMASVFTHHDSLLGAQGHIPVYYWVIRGHRKAAAGFREFLDDFTQRVSENLKIFRDDPDRADATLMAYYTQGRTTNDEASLTGRYETLISQMKRRKLL